MEINGWTDLSDSHTDTASQQIPISLIRSGRYYYSSGDIGKGSSEGNFWESNPYSTTYAYGLNFYSTRLHTQYTNFNKGYGYALRCLVRWMFCNSLPTVVLKAIRTYWLRCMGWKAAIQLDITIMQIHKHNLYHWHLFVAAPTIIVPVILAAALMAAIIGNLVLWEAMLET